MKISSNENIYRVLVTNEPGRTCGNECHQINSGSTYIKAIIGFPKMVNQWNKLGGHEVSADTINTFKKRVDKFWIVRQVGTSSQELPRLYQSCGLLLVFILISSTYILVLVTDIESQCGNKCHRLLRCNPLCLTLKKTKSNTGPIWIKYIVRDSNATKAIEQSLRY